jgi:protein-S-isoprenylcysteine O-methyltransferase Ste14
MTTASPNPYEPSREPVLAALAPTGSGLMRDGETLSVAYEVSMEELVQFSLYHLTNSPAERRKYYRNVLTVPVFSIIGFLGPAFVLRYDLWDSLPLNICVGVLLIILSFVYPLRYRSRFEHTIRKLYSEGRNAAISGVWRIVNSPARLSVFMPLVETHYQWPAVERVVRTERALYVYVTAVEAIIVPLRAFGNVQESGEFEAAVKARIVK